MTYEPISTRFPFGFSEEVEAAFEFLIGGYGFSCVKSDPTFVRFESSSAFVNVSYDHISYELDIEIGSATQPPDRAVQGFGLSEILELAGVLEETGYTFFQASTKERVKRLVARLAALTRDYAGPALVGDTSTFEALAAIRTARSSRYMKEMRLSQIREAADIAWRAKDYLKVIELYEGMGADLSDLEAKKLQYVRSHI
ncbi:MAG: hypothetical protein ACJ78Q_16505 [Chloroflexia bacterium]